MSEELYSVGTQMRREHQTEVINPAALKRWSSKNKELPPVSQIKSLHVYDFDNTLFKTPLPNPKLWISSTASRLHNEDVFENGGWWHDKGILEATGDGAEIEESRAWSGWWNEQIVELVKLSVDQSDALTVLLTGRGERGYASLIQRMVNSKGLDFDMVCLKLQVGHHNQPFSSTLQYKQGFLRDLLDCYSQAVEVKVYEDRPKQTKAFRDFFQSINQNAFSETSHPRITATVIQVADQAAFLDPVVEAAEVQKMINRHNAQLRPMARPLLLKRTVFYTGYLISPADTAKLLDLVKVPSHLVDSEVRYLANAILITPRPAESSILDRVGGLGHKQAWQVTDLAFYQALIWAARVVPVPPGSNVHTINSTPLIVLATYKNTKPEYASKIQSWQPIPTDKQCIIQTVVGERAQLRMETESGESEIDSALDRRYQRRRPTPNQSRLRNGIVSDENRRAGNAAGRTTNQPRYSSISGRGSGGQVGGRGGRFTINGPGGRGNRQKGSRGGYRSLDDVPVGTGRHGAERNGQTYQDYIPGGAQYDSGFGAAKGSSMDVAGGLPYGK